MQWQLALVAISLFLLARTAKALAAAESLDARPPNRRTQLLLGLVCGGVGALVATVPFADSVGDRFGDAAHHRRVGGDGGGHRAGCDPSSPNGAAGLVERAGNHRVGRPRMARDPHRAVTPSGRAGGERSRRGRRRRRVGALERRHADRLVA